MNKDQFTIYLRGIDGYVTLDTIANEVNIPSATVLNQLRRAAFQPVWCPSHKDWILFGL